MYKNWANDSEVRKFLTWEPHGSIDVSRDILKSWIDEYKLIDYFMAEVTVNRS